mmetsp:Transcript_17872/g.32838  ORF Transcript_17872/g.32838 Transcript_17872/m.32838 type:complete len:312 (+) Transcript_17872:305-1240(+)
MAARPRATASRSPTFRLASTAFGSMAALILLLRMLACSGRISGAAACYCDLGGCCLGGRRLCRRLQAHWLRPRGSSLFAIATSTSDGGRSASSTASACNFRGGGIRQPLGLRPSIAAALCGSGASAGGYSASLHACWLAGCRTGDSIGASVRASIGGLRRFGFYCWWTASINEDRMAEQSNLVNDPANNLELLLGHLVAVHTRLDYHMESLFCSAGTRCTCIPVSCTSELQATSRLLHHEADVLRAHSKHSIVGRSLLLFICRPLKLGKGHWHLCRIIRRRLDSRRRLDFFIFFTSAACCGAIWISRLPDL